MQRSWGRAISPPPSRKHRKVKDEQSRTSDKKDVTNPSPAAIEAGEAIIDDHLQYFVQKFALVSRSIADMPSMGLPDFEALYHRNQHPGGKHFVVHQHDHPIAGTHYDLRLQFSATSAISFAIPYGLPGNPSSSRPNRMAIETRVHNLWNNLIESASHDTGSLLIWDTGEYEVLPYRDPPEVSHTDDELSSDEIARTIPLSHSKRLFAAFQDKHIRLRLHGHRLPHDYTISLRLPRNNYQGHVKDPSRKRRRITAAEKSDSSRSDASDVMDEDDHRDAANASEDEEDASIRANNAYTGATNDIGSVHQRHWFLSLDKSRSKLFKPFFVMGRDVERSIVTSRNADEVLADEGVARFIGRKSWRPIIE